MKNTRHKDDMEKQLPHFLIVGAPKAGTTSLYRYLQQHPQIFMPENKEPRFFCNYPVKEFEFGVKQFHPDIISNASDYLSIFLMAPDDAVCGEASTDYLSCEGAAARIFAFNPKMKIIIMLRKPVDRAYSEYQHSIVANFHTKTFRESLSLEDERYRNRYDPIFFHVRRGLYYGAVSDYLNHFNRDHVKIILYEEFAESPSSVVHSVFDFLGLPSVPVDVTTRYNVSNRHADVRKVLTAIEYDCLNGLFRRDILQLQDLLKVNLEHWL